MIKNKYKGMLWGLVAGDCLGSPIQFSEKDDHPYINQMEPAVGIYGRDLPKGYWTDDSSMAFGIMESFIRQKHFDLNDIANNFVRWYEEGFLSSVQGWAFDVGGATDDAMANIRNGSLVNGDEDGQGNGSLMRYAPAFILEREGKGKDICRKINDLTHNSDFVRKQMKRLHDALEAALSGEKSRISTSYTDRADVPNSGWAKDTVDAAFWAFCNTDNFKDGMLAAVNLGGDSDSIAAVYGQIAGAYYGYNAIPQEWICDVKDHQWVDNFINQFIEDAMKINTLLDLWKHWCNICSAEQEKNGDIPGSIMNDVIRPNNRLAECLDIIEHISKPEEYCTQILCGLLNQIEDFQFEFLKKIGVIHEENRKKFKPYLVKAEHPVYKLENGRKKLEYKYDISFWLKDEEEKLICIVEVKIDANFQNNQLKNYLEILENCDNGKALVLLTKYNMNSYKEVTDIFEPTSRNKVIFANVFWYEIVELIKCYCDKYDLAWQAFELFTSEYFLFQEKGVSQVGEKFEREFFIDKIKEICDNTDNKIVYHEHGSFKKRCITLLTSRYGEKNWYGGLLALNIWLDGYLITDKYEDVDADLPKQLNSKAYPFFDIVIKCYYQVENHDIRKEDLITIKQFSENDYEDFCIYDKKNTKKIKHKLFRKSLSEKIRISDKKTLDDEIKNLDSAVWKWLKKEIFKWQEIVCDNKS